MTEQERYDALLADLRDGEYDGHSVSGWALGGDDVTLIVTIGFSDGTDNQVINFDATQVQA